MWWNDPTRGVVIPPSCCQCLHHRPSQQWEQWEQTLIGKYKFSQTPEAKEGACSHNTGFHDGPQGGRYSSLLQQHISVFTSPDCRGSVWSWLWFFCVRFHYLSRLFNSGVFYHYHYHLLFPWGTLRVRTVFEDGWWLWWSSVYVTWIKALI